MADDKNPENYTDILLEDISGKMQILADGISALQDTTKELKVIVSDIPEMRDDIKAIKSAVTNHERRITHLEAA